MASALFAAHEARTLSATLPTERLAAPDPARLLAAARRAPAFALPGRGVF